MLGLTSTLGTSTDIFSKNNDGKTVLDYAKSDEVKELILKYAK